MSQFPRPRMQEIGRSADAPLPRYIVIGHLTPTDATPEEVWGTSLGNLDADIVVVACDTREQAEHMLLWYTDGLIREIHI